MSKKHSDDQKLVIDQFGEFIDSSSQVLIISGSAGTGKTSLIKDFAKIVFKKKPNLIHNIFKGVRNLELIIPNIS